VSQHKSVVGLDVHATQTHSCVRSRPRRASFAPRRLNGPPALDHLEVLQAPVLAVYEAGRTGYGSRRRRCGDLKGSVASDVGARIWSMTAKEKLCWSGRLS
jgi:hypothetical protein